MAFGTAPWAPCPILMGHCAMGHPIQLGPMRPFPNETMIKTTTTLAATAFAVLTLSNCATTTSPTTGTGGGSTTTPSTTATSGVEAYPFDTCIVTDNELGSMGDVITIAHEGQEVKFCCAPCIKKFNNNPTKYMARLDQWKTEGL